MAYDESSGFLYVSHDSYSVAAGAPQFAISRIALSGHPIRHGGSWENVYKSPQLPLTTYYAGRGAGGKMLISGRLLYFAIGDYSFDRIISSRSDIAAQNSRSPFGKIYSYDLDRKLFKVTSIGHRVPQGLAVTAAGQILETEHGPRGGDELNIIEDGGNYGWPYISYGTRYFSYRPYLDSSNFNEKTIEPVFAWVPSIAATALFESKRFDIRWRGDVIVGSLKAQSLFRLKINQRRVVFAEPIWMGYRVRDMVEQEGRILVWTDDGSIVTIVPELKLLAADRLGEAEGYKNPALAACTGCHSLERKNQFYWAPTLNGIYGAKIAGEAFQNYSEALKLKNGTWDDATLTAFLRDPQSFAPGTTMTNPDLSPSQLSQVLNALRNLPRN
jgi:cytochrome c2